MTFDKLHYPARVRATRITLFALGQGVSTSPARLYWENGARLPPSAAARTNFGILPPVAITLWEDVRRSPETPDRHPYRNPICVDGLKRSSYFAPCEQIELSAKIRVVLRSFRTIVERVEVSLPGQT